ncbi:MAG: hypothetical protein A3F41_06180 [Coxiella sp. RIFCSPHIGHO2_12_FULL_44_14]|nr:MAG: hypothetical protein A3F41_06180 [Coxiella sp. RIFCSPHIGHO2_12_FULL_44_14]
MSTRFKNRTIPKSDQDSAWKEILDVFFREFLEFFFPDIAQQIDWARGFEFLDKELQSVFSHPKGKRRTVDKLVRVYQLNGQEQWLLLHIEVQGKYEIHFECRLFEYYYRLYDKYHAPILPLVILTDDRPQWRPDHYESSVLGNPVIQFQFQVKKLSDYRDQRDALEQTRNPFGAVVLAQLAALDTRYNLSHRFQQKIYLTKLLYHRGWNKEQILNLYKFIDWILTLPEELAIEYNNQIQALTEEKTMAYITTAERIGIKKGLEEGMRLAKEKQQEYITTAERIGIKKGLEEGMRLAKEKQQEYITTAERIGIKKGLEEGMRLAKEKQQEYITTAERIGIKKGFREGEYLLLLRLLKRKFHTVPESYQEQLRTADTETLLCWAERIFEADSLEEVFN